MRAGRNLCLGMSVALLALVAGAADLAAQAFNQRNFAQRKAYTIGLCPHVQIVQFEFGNVTRRNEDSFQLSFKWKNTAAQPVVAFEIVTLRYDPFDRQIIGSSLMVEGKNSADWSPLAPGETSGDGTIGYRGESVMTAIAYVRHVRLQDGTVWSVDQGKLLAEVRKVAPNLREPGDLSPKPPTPKQP